MKEKKDYQIITFHTTIQAMSFEKKCMEHGIPGRLIPVPTKISAGCGLAWRIQAAEYSQFAKKIQDLEPEVEQIVPFQM